MSFGSQNRGQRPDCREHETAPASGSALPNLSRCAWRGCTGECLQPPLNTTVPGKFPEASLRGLDAVFWPQEYASTIDKLNAAAAKAYAYDKYIYYADDYDFAQENEKNLNRQAELQTIPLQNDTQTLYHWTDQFPSAEYLADKERVLTYGFVWTSTAKEFFWKKQQRVEIRLPQNEDVKAFIDPKSHSRYINCNGERKMDREHHNDVVLQPSVFKLLERKLDWDLVDSVLQMSMEASEPPENIVSFERVADPPGWEVKCKNVGEALNFLWREQRSIGTKEPWKWVLYGSVSVKSQQEGLLFVDATKIALSPVLEWAGDNKNEPPVPKDD